MQKDIKKNIFIGIGLATIVYFLFISFNDWSSLKSSFSNYPISHFVFAQILMFLVIYLKYIRWSYYIGVLRLKISTKDSILVFTSGLLMSITPGKVGELLKSFLIKDKYQIPISVSSPIIVSERIIEFIALLILGLFGLLLYNLGAEYLVITLISIAVIIIIMIIYRFQNYIFQFVMKFSKSAVRLDDIKVFRSSLNTLFRKKHLIKMLLLSIFTWIIECFAFYLILFGLFENQSIIWAIFSYTFAIFIGAISMLPGGIGTTEGTLLYVLNQKQIIESDALLITFFIRIITLWIPVIIGFISLLLYFRNSKA